MYCSKCGSPNDETSQFCSKCGAALAGTNVKSNSGQVSDNDSSDQDDIYKAVIGPKHQDAYLQYFLKADRLGKARVSWHWPAVFVTFYWLLYRKMWTPAITYFFLPYLILIPIAIAAAAMGKSSDTFIGFAYLAYIVSLFILPPMYANAAYYKHCKRKIAQVQRSTPDLQRQLGELTGRGGTSNVVFIFVVIFGFIFIIGILAAVALPAYQDYTIRAKIAEAVVTGRVASTSVEAFYVQNQRIPATLEEAGFNAPRSTSIRGVSVNGQNGVVSVTMSTSPIEGKSLLMVPSEGANGAISWRCQSEDIPQKYLPTTCRQ